MSTELRTGPDAGDDGFHEIQLNGKQLVFLGMATTLVSVVIFLCGVLVGRGVRPIEPVAEAAGMGLPVAESTVAEAAPTPGAPATAAPAAEPTPVSEGDYYDALPDGRKAEAARAETAATPAPAPAAAKAADAPKPAAAAPARASKPVDGEGVEPKPADAKPADAKPAEAKPAAAPIAVTPAEPKPAEPAIAEAKTPATKPTVGGKVAVQVAALGSRADAEAVARRLSGKGYAAYVVSPEPGGKAVFRVRVGNYASLDEAQRISSRLAQEEKLKPWIIR